LISQIKKNINIPIICGGGIDSVDKLVNCWKAGCDIVVVGNALESNPELIFDLKSTGK
jgi:heptaprenylglyceryl phosphate synthase